MKITTVLLFALVVFLFGMACSKSVRVFQTKGKTYFEELFVHTNDNIVRI